jgi:hypothetical protein
LPVNAPVRDAEYNAMVTILMYADASKVKTTTAAVGDLASIRRMKQLVRGKMQMLPAGGRFPAALLEQIRAEIQSEFEARGRDSVSRAARAVATEQQGVGDARGKAAESRPTKDELAAAYAAQLDQVLEFLEERVKAVERFRASGRR